MSSALKLVDSEWSASQVSVGENITQSFHLVLDEGLVPVIQTQSELNYFGKITDTDIEILNLGDQIEFVWNLTWLVLDKEEANLSKHFVKIYNQEGVLVEEYQVNSSPENFPKVEVVKFEKTIEEELIQWAPQDKVTWSPWSAAIILVIIPIVYLMFKFYHKRRLTQVWKTEQTIFKLQELLQKNVSLEELSQVRNELFSATHHVLKQIYFPQKMGDTWSQSQSKLTHFDFEKFARLEDFIIRSSCMRLVKGAELNEVKSFHSRVLGSLDLLNQLHEWSYRSHQQSLTLGSQFEEASQALRAWINCLEAHRV